MNTEQEQQYQIAVCQALGWVHEKAGSLVVHPILGMELVCGECRAVILNDGSYNWAKHESCGPMGCECYGGRWKLFKSCWVKGNNKVMPLPPLTLDLCAQMREALSPAEREAFVEELGTILELDGVGNWSNADAFIAIDATATAQVNAFLRVKGMA